MLIKNKSESFIILNFLKFYLTNGNKQISENVIRSTFSILKKIKKTNPISIISSSIEIVKPFCEIKSVKIGGSNYKVPTEIHPVRQRVLAIKFLVSNSMKRNEKSSSRCVAMEIFDTFSISSQSVKNCDDVHKIAEANKVYIQYRN
jgi:small subunit ribosomal protein S7|tara:strand:+ start:751 stop:1188 length:438 start_codon:yes stop_codon:yes gene_type:complete